MRVWFAVASLAIAGLHGGCSKAKTLSCTESIAQACGGNAGCVLTWDEVQTGNAVCAGQRPLRIECGAYNAVSISSVDTSRTYYYDAASGMLVAIVLASPVSGSSCAAGPAGGFTVPTCEGAASEPLPQCLDGGVDAAGGDGATD